MKKSVANWKGGMMVVAVRPLGRDKEEALREEQDLHDRMMALINDPSFWEAHQRGLDQIAQGKTITLAELEARFG